MAAAYEEQATALIEGGVDVLLIETAQDLLQAKVATVGVLEAMRKSGKRLPVTVQVTLQESGTMLLGTEIGAALTALELFDVDVVGINCATGPKEMNDAVRYLGLNSTKQISVLPNAGLPINEGGHAVYKLSPEELAQYHKHFVQDFGVRIVGGCCGTKPEHLRAVVDAVSGVEPAVRDVKPVGAASRTEALDCGRGDEYHHQGGAFPQSCAWQEVRRDSGAREETRERGLAHAGPVLRDRGRGRKKLHHVDSGTSRDSCAGSHPG